MIITQEKHPSVTNPVKSKSSPGSRQKQIVYLP